MSESPFSRVRALALRVLRRASAARPARQRARRSVAVPVRSEPLPETGATIRRFFGGEALPATERPAIPDVTVVIPVYDSAAWLDDCLSSVLAQTRVSLEVVCVDDGSADASSRVLSRYAAADPRVVILEQQNSGQSVARNTGLAAARGRYLIYLDSDDFWREDRLADLVAMADRDRLDVLLFDGIAFRDGRVREQTWDWYATYYPRVRRHRRVRSGARMIADLRRWGDYRPHVGMYLSRTDFVRRSEVAFIPGIVHQDNPYTFSLLLAAERVSHVGFSMYARRMREGSTITALKEAASAKGYFLSYLAMSRVLRQRTFDAAVTDRLQGVIAGVFASARKRIAVLPAEAQEQLGQLDASGDAQAALAALRSSIRTGE
ncbi:glycosyltransferase [Microbacterium sp. ARD32]|uniref:glycosyltransferase n=1 Tax=Microbacterium sp. ARD32 TaxID=2962577 RepID=UPI0028823359|nr:glycosyltransferase [Microbacterium sp. ARD32]MDT0156397.1 glycosyltransferase [Microbacterium sp. ARD32]